MRIAAVVVAAALGMTPLGARGADLVVWWEQGFYPQEDAAVREIVAAFEQETGKEVELVLVPQVEIRGRADAAFEAGQPPDFVWGTQSQNWAPVWAYKDRLAGLENTLGPFLDLFDADTIDTATLLNRRTGRRLLYLDAPFWLDPSDPHRMRAAMQTLTQAHLINVVARLARAPRAKKANSRRWASDAAGRTGALSLIIRRGGRS